MKPEKKIGLFWKFFIIYAVILCILAAVSLIYVNALLRDFEASQPERVVEKQIELMKESAAKGELESVMPITDEVKHILGEEKYPESFVRFIAENDLTYEQTVGSYGADATTYNIICGEKVLAEAVLSSTNERTEMIVFTCADWSLKELKPSVLNAEFTLPVSVSLKVNGESVKGTKEESGKLKYALTLLGDADIEISDLFGNVEKQYGKVRNIFAETRFTVPSSFNVSLQSGAIPADCVTAKTIKEFEYVSAYCAMPTLCTYNLAYIPMKDVDPPQISIYDNLGGKVEYSFGDKLNITKFASEDTVPENLLKDAAVLEFARSWSLFMTNDLSGGLNSLSKYLLKDTYLYQVAYKWATGIDRTFTSIHSLYNPPFVNEKVSNYVKYSENCFSCDVYLVKRMRIANGLNVDDELSRKIFFVKVDTTKDGKDNPVWKVADMLGADAENEDGGESDE